ncbi:ventricular zone-expressed PH domain-containing protein isoform X2 [Dunckerocampus dactyliophorus]|nr:ventricular zone-expressed PH domain-containing protein isoform X2 [Dunckerocampus dactyliophorus]XP_054649546.1 ventricular zone-expressed PH domain-containing protein isoform X2 [Dunckerocampus dactyliophorus]XP_054649547.1 ventricular zone-expressed PH domain-containing protein isoform X2 [Dunckerocampus dactyliophorus]
MVLAVPVAVRFLHRGNRELSRNMSSYLSLAAIAEIDLLADHTEAITLSVLAGNPMLLRVLPSVYPRQPDIIHCHLGKLTAMMSQLDSAEQQHLIRLLQMVAEQHPLMLSPQVPALVGYLGNQSLIEAILGTLVDVSQASPSSLVSSLPKLRTVGQQWPALLGHVAKIHGAVGIISETHAHASLVYLVSLLGNMEHTFHHTLLLEIRGLTDRYPSVLGVYGKDLYRLSNSFTAIAKLLGRRLEESATTRCSENGVEPSPSSSAPLQGGSKRGGSKQRQQVKAGGEMQVQEDSPAPQRRYSLSHAVREEQREVRFNRSKSLALHAVRSRSINSDGGEDAEGVELSPDNITFTSTLPCQQSSVEHQEVTLPAKKLTDNVPASATMPDRGVKESERGQSAQKNKEEEEVGVADRLFVHLRNNMEMIREFCKDMVQHIPIPEQCVIEESNRGCVAKLSFSCPLKGHYCLYAKSSFNLSSRQPHLWIQIMLLHLQSKSNVPLCSGDECVQRLASLWGKTQLKGAHSFHMAMTQHATPHRKDLDSLQMQLEEVRFFDLFGYSEEEGGWLCFMCNNPEKATGVNQEGQPLIEGKLKEKQVRWRFIKRWKTRYFTLAGNQLLFWRGKSKDELDDIPIELSKVQSVKVVAKKRRDRGLPRAFEIFTDSKTYVLKAQDEKHAEEWLQCINVAVAQARERENREATTYL